MTYNQIAQNYVNMKYLYPPNWAEQCGCDPIRLFLPPTTCGSQACAPGNNPICPQVSLVTGNTCCEKKVDCCPPIVCEETKPCCKKTCCKKSCSKKTCCKEKKCCPPVCCEKEICRQKEIVYVNMPVPVFPPFDECKRPWALNACNTWNARRCFDAVCDAGPCTTGCLGGPYIQKGPFANPSGIPSGIYEYYPVGNNIPTRGPYNPAGSASAYGPLVNGAVNLGPATAPYQ